jgi:hypothetical protein
MYRRFRLPSSQTTHSNETTHKRPVEQVATQQENHVPIQSMKFKLPETPSQRYGASVLSTEVEMSPRKGKLPYKR